MNLKIAQNASVQIKFIDQFVTYADDEWGKK